jgi:hypothetical protein
MTGGFATRSDPSLACLRKWCDWGSALCARNNLNAVVTAAGYSTRARTGGTCRER